MATDRQRGKGQRGGTASRARGGARPGAGPKRTICCCGHLTVRLDRDAAAGLRAYMRRRGIDKSRAVRELLSAGGAVVGATAGRREAPL